jgi:hypothetical protein
MTVLSREENNENEIALLQIDSIEFGKWHVVVC